MSAKTVQDLLSEAEHALDPTMEPHDAHLQAELLLAGELEITRASTLARLNETVGSDLAARYGAKVERRAAGEPLAYILGQQVFFGLDFLVDRRVLIPRHETEELVRLVLEYVSPTTEITIVDIGTGSGALALSLAHHLPYARVIATDISREAIEVAHQNAIRLNLESRVEFIESDLLSGVEVTFDVLVSNLPYIPSKRIGQLPKEICVYEPCLALDGGEDGLRVMRCLLSQLDSHAARGAMALLEISEEQGPVALEAVRRALPHTGASLHREFEGLDRAIEIKWNVDG